MLFEFIIVALILYLIDVYVPMQPAFKTVFRVGCVVVAVWYLMQFLGVSLPARLTS